MGYPLLFLLLSSLLIVYFNGFSVVHALVVAEEYLNVEKCKEAQSEEQCKAEKSEETHPEVLVTCRVLGYAVPLEEGGRVIPRLKERTENKHTTTPE